MPRHGRFSCQMGCGRGERFAYSFGRMDFKGSFLARDTRSHQENGAYVFRLMSIFGILVRCTMVMLAICPRVHSMQPMVQLWARNGQLSQQKLRCQEQKTPCPDHGMAHDHSDGSKVA